jgi:hypothetical protein
MAGMPGCIASFDGTHVVHEKHVLSISVQITGGKSFALQLDILAHGMIRLSSCLTHF